MRFAHLADCHIGAWGEQKLRDLNTQAFSEAIDRCVKVKVDFILISGDLFNTALPAIDCLKLAVKKLRQVQDAGIPVYYIAGSHDFSPSGKTMLDVLDEAGLMINAAKGEVKDGKLCLSFVEDATGAKITGMIGKKGGLEKEYYKELNLGPLEQEQGFKIFMFHTALTELKPKHLEKMDSNPISFLPKGFQYYAGGHVHIVRDESLEGYQHVVYPGPLFPNSFSEIEKLGCGGFYWYEDGNVWYDKVEIKKTCCFTFNCTGKTSDGVLQLVEEELRKISIRDAVVTLRFSGTLKESKVSDVDFKEILEKCYERGAYVVLKNSSKLIAAGFEEVIVKHQSLEEAEHSIIQEHAGQSKLFAVDKEKGLIKELIQVLSAEKGEGERGNDYDSRLHEGVDKILLE